jgi:hypothetical protein
MAIAILELIRKYFEQTFRLTGQDCVTFSSKLTRTEVAKRQLLLKAGQTENYLAFVEKEKCRKS